MLHPPESTTPISCQRAPAKQGVYLILDITTWLQDSLMVQRWLGEKAAAQILCSQGEEHVTHGQYTWGWKEGLDLPVRMGMEP